MSEGICGGRCTHVIVDVGRDEGVWLAVDGAMVEQALVEGVVLLRIVRHDEDGEVRVEQLVARRR